METLLPQTMAINFVSARHFFLLTSILLDGGVYREIPFGAPHESPCISLPGESSSFVTPPLLSKTFKLSSELILSNRPQTPFSPHT